MKNEQKIKINRKLDLILLCSIAVICYGAALSYALWSEDKKYAKERQIEKLYDDIYPYLKKLDGDSNPVIFSIKEELSYEDQRIFRELMNEQDPFDFRKNPNKSKKRLNELLDSLRQVELRK